MLLFVVTCLSNEISKYCFLNLLAVSKFMKLLSLLLLLALIKADFVLLYVKDYFVPKLIPRSTSAFPYFIVLLTINFIH